MVESRRCVRGAARRMPRRGGGAAARSGDGGGTRNSGRRTRRPCRGACRARRRPTRGTSTRSSQRGSSAAAVPAPGWLTKRMRRRRKLDDLREVHPAAERPRPPQHDGWVDLAIEGFECGDAGARRAEARGSRCGDRSRPRPARARPPARRGARRACAAAGCVDRQPSRKSRGATRLCRLGPLLSTRSNRWSRPRHLRLSATRRTCTMLSLSRAPGCFTLGSRGSQARIEHRRWRQTVGARASRAGCPVISCRARGCASARIPRARAWP